MNTKSLIVAVVILASSTSSFANEWVDFSDFQSTKTRAEVLDELKASQDNGTYIAGGVEFDAPTAKFTSSRSRAEVIAELEQSKLDGSYTIAHQEFSDQFGYSQSSASRGARIAGNGNANEVN